MGTGPRVALLRRASSQRRWLPRFSLMHAHPMRGYVGLTDSDWYRQLHSRRAVEVNFWTPSARVFKAIEVGAPFFFLLKAPYNAVCGFGIFEKFTRLPDWLAWEAFGVANGVESADEL